MKVHRFETKKTAFYAQLGELNSNCNDLYFVLHGYGQLARDFIQGFEHVLIEGRCFIAPEGLSKFYKRGLYGEVGATWMTKEEREHDIEDYIFYLNSLFSQLLGKCSERTRVHVIGFSQGAATASRWVDNGKILPSSLTLWSGAFAHDLSISFHHNLAQTKVFTVCGLQDKIYPPEMMKDQINTLTKEGFNPTEIYFEGKHQLDDKALEELILKIDSWDN